METIYSLMEKYQMKRKTFFNSEEYIFFLDNRELLTANKRFAFLYDFEDDDFGVMRANIIIYSYMNKKTMTKEIYSFKKQLREGVDVDISNLQKAMKERIKSLYFYNDGNMKIYLPFFPKAINSMYINNPEKLLVEPYDSLNTSFARSMIDPFDTYGYHLYNSSFTRLVLVKESKDKKEAAFFHYDTNTIYFINDEGRLDNKLVLFDKFLSHKNTSHILERIEGVIDAYFSFDRSKMIDELHDNKFISGRLMALFRKVTENHDDI